MFLHYIQFFMMYDSGDGSISKEEFVAWWLERGNDLDGDGKPSAIKYILVVIAILFSRFIALLIILLSVHVSYY
jgi:hypothetical protein